MNNSNFKHIFLILIGVSFLIISIGVFYYYIIELPRYNQEKLELEERKYNEEQDKIKNEEEKENLNKIELNNCITNASFKYTQDWTSNCIEMKNNTPELYKEDESGRCGLPTKISEKLGETFRETRDECYRKFENKLY